METCHRVKTCHSSTRIRFGSSHFSLSKNVIHGMKLHKHEDIIWYYYMEFTFLLKIWLKYGISMNIFSKKLTWYFVFSEF